MTLYLGVALIVAAVVLFIMQPVVKGIHASLEREDDELTETEARKRVALLALRDVEYDFLAGKLDEEDYRSLKADLTAEAMAALEADEASRAGTVTAVPAGGTAGAAAKAAAAGTAATAGNDLEAEIARIREGLRSGTTCSACDFTNEEGSRFCSACGHALADPVTT